MGKINSEISKDNGNFKVKIGTVDKKNPETAYIEICTYISPINDYESYDCEIKKMIKKCKVLSNDFVSNSGICKNDNIFSYELADERICNKKKSFFVIGLYIKPNLDLKRTTFKNISNVLYEKISSKMLIELETAIKTSGFECYKTRK